MNDPRKYARSLAFLTIALLLFATSPVARAQQAEAQSQSSSGVFLFQEANYGGSRVAIPQNIPDLAAMGFSDKTSSIKLNGVTPIAVFDGPGYGGACQTFTYDVPSLVGTNVGNDKIPSIMLRTTCEGTAPTVILYQDPNFLGAQLKMHEDAPDLGAKGFADKTSSLKLIGIPSVALFQRPNFGGKCQTFTTHIPSLVNSAVGNDRASSARVKVACENPKRIAISNDAGVVLLTEVAVGGRILKYTLPLGMDHIWWLDPATPVKIRFSIGPGRTFEKALTMDKDYHYGLTGTEFKAPLTENGPVIYTFAK